MSCCLIAAFLVAQGLAMLRRWGMFWGLVEVPEGETVETVYSKIRDRLTSKRMRPVILAIAAVELAAVGVWLYHDHRQHITEFVDVTWSRMQGEDVVYMGLCGPSGDKRVRVVLSSSPNVT